ncbi:MAG: PGPGW domain-containing protein [Verrucomicrobiales bacterium]
MSSLLTYSLPALVALPAAVVVYGIVNYRRLDRQAAAVGRELSSLSLVIWRQARRIVILVVGSSVILFGLALVFLPGPAIVVIPLGLAILAIEFAWARRWLRHLRVRLALAARKTFRARRRRTGQGDRV